jgi:hypothetical protein
MFDTNLTRRQFATCFAGTGLGTTLLPGVLGAELQEAGSPELTSDMLVDELDRNEWFHLRTVVYAPPFRESKLLAVAYQDATVHQPEPVRIRMTGEHGREGKGRARRLPDQRRQTSRSKLRRRWRSLMGLNIRRAWYGLLLLLLGCASSGEGSVGSTPGTLTRAGLLETDEVILYEAIQRLRPRWLRPRGANAAGRTLAQVFVDGAPRGDVAALRQIQVIDVIDVRFLSTIDAATQYGTLAGIGGAVIVRTGR